VADFGACGVVGKGEETSKSFNHSFFFAPLSIITFSPFSFGGIEKRKKLNVVNHFVEKIPPHHRIAKVFLMAQGLVQ
jgi:hypothetical protein